MPVHCGTFINIDIAMQLDTLHDFACVYAYVKKRPARLLSCSPMSICCLVNYLPIPQGPNGPNQVGPGDGVFPLVYTIYPLVN